MKVYVDGLERPEFSESASESESESDASAILEGVDALLAREGRVLMEVRVDDAPMDREAFVNVVGGMAAYFTSQPVRGLVQETLDEALVYLPSLERGFESVALCLEQDKAESAQGTLALAADGLDWLVGVFDRCARILSAGEETGSDKVLGTLRDDIERLSTFYEEKKYLNMALCIRQNLLPDLDQVRACLKAFCELAVSTH
ncbi:MAG: hypothetical protein LBR38_04140 [Synergistaceae bacterium]|nr:hypothetical protein [Synergistaceae bacterium]